MNFPPLGILHHYCTNPDTLRYRDTTGIYEALRLRGIIQLTNSSALRFWIWSFISSTCRLHFTAFL